MTTGGRTVLVTDLGDEAIEVGNAGWSISGIHPPMCAAVAKERGEEMLVEMKGMPKWSKEFGWVYIESMGPAHGAEYSNGLKGEAWPEEV